MRSVQAGRWVSTAWATVTNPAMAGADFYLEVSVASDGSFQGTWAAYTRLTGAYGMLSCSKGRSEGAASGRFDAGGTGSIELARLGRTTLTWSVKRAGEIAIELPKNWQGTNLLFKSTVKRT